MTRSALAALLTSLLLLSGCGSGDEGTVRQNLAESMTQQQNEDDLVALDDEEADCVAGRMVDDIGVDQLQEYGFVDENLEVQQNLNDLEMSEQDSEALVDAMFECTDVMASIRKSFSEEMPAGNPKMKKCFDDALTEKAVRGLLVAVFSGAEGQQASQELMAPMMKCAMEFMDVPSQ